MSAGVAPDVNVRNQLSAGNRVHKRGIHPGFETQGRYHQPESPKQGNQWINVKRE